MTINTSTHTARPCLMSAWSEHAQALGHWLKAKAKDEPLAEDLLQEVFIRAMIKDHAFCYIENPRAWLYRVANNLLIDHSRKRHPVQLEQDIEQENDSEAVIDTLTQCLTRVLSELPEQDSHVLRACDIQKMPQQEYANQNGLTLPAVKSRLLRARGKLRQQLVSSCKVMLDADQHVCCFTPREGS
ncbi:sigma-70 family RNA polymerase sigma factor [Photobacterium lutimaris]|uniref:RNA polymerase sigma factor n=1 Tax=Photobacterium lutimaris TaxID=388278 RepID=A0A2T3IZC7_9GAMM|nr:sigma-70 family RNA polymerase sigma factor [Photobacterium lutimaris]PSU34010.1 RNA polymerase subunit sigma-70 [Photobacterium lutimaris]TDR76349.1 RNA polymerase sigma (SigZ) subunit [Photobacterium lutimaris]